MLEQDPGTHVDIDRPIIDFHKNFNIARVITKPPPLQYISLCSVMQNQLVFEDGSQINLSKMLVCIE